MKPATSMAATSLACHAGVTTGHDGGPPMISDDDLLTLLHESASAAQRALTETGKWGLAGTRPGQYDSDLAADAAIREVLDAARVGVLSEESGTARLDAP